MPSINQSAALEGCYNVGRNVMKSIGTLFLHPNILLFSSTSKEFQLAALVQSINNMQETYQTEYSQDTLNIDTISLCICLRNLYDNGFFGTAPTDTGTLKLMDQRLQESNPSGKYSTYVEEINHRYRLGYVSEALRLLNEKYNIPDLLTSPFYTQEGSKKVNDLLLSPKLTFAEEDQPVVSNILFYLELLHQSFYKRRSDDDVEHSSVGGGAGSPTTSTSPVVTSSLVGVTSMMTRFRGFMPLVGLSLRLSRATRLLGDVGGRGLSAEEDAAPSATLPTSPGAGAGSSVLAPVVHSGTDSSIVAPPMVSDTPRLTQEQIGVVVSIPTTARDHSNYNFENFKTLMAERYSVNLDDCGGFSAKTFVILINSARTQNKLDMLVNDLKDLNIALGLNHDSTKACYTLNAYGDRLNNLNVECLNQYSRVAVETYKASSVATHLPGKP